MHAACRKPEADSEGSVQRFDALAPDTSALQWPERLDGFVYFPGSINLKPFHRLSEEDFLNEYRINFLGAVTCLQSVRPALVKSGSSSVVLFSTVAAASGQGMQNALLL